MKIRVHCHAGYRADEEPRAFVLDGREIRVMEVLGRWLGPDHRSFEVRGDDGRRYVLRYDERAGDWTLE